MMLPMLPRFGVIVMMIRLMVTSMVARLRMMRKNLPRSWVSALSVRHHSKSDTWSLSDKTYNHDNKTLKANTTSDR